MKISKWMKPWVCVCAALGAISCALLSVDISRMLAYEKYAGWMTAIPVILWVACTLGAAYSILYMVVRIREAKTAEVPAELRDHKKHEWIIYLCTVLIITIGLFILYGNLDLAYPMLNTGGDELGIYALTKSIIQNGTTLITPLEGGVTGGDMFDYPYSDKLSFLFVRLIGIFIKNPYTVVALFFFLNHYLAALIGAFVCRKLKISPPMAVMAGVLYAFSSFIQLRFSHMWLTAYYTLPIACLVAVWIIEGKAFEEGVPLRRSKTFCRMAAGCYACAFTGLYYAFFTCAIISAAMVIRCFREKERKLSRILYPSILIGVVIAGVLTNVIPNLMYWSLCGANPVAEVSTRNPMESEIYSLKLLRMLLPRNFHRISTFWGIASRYYGYPLSNENNTAALGLISSAGFIMSIIMLLAGRKKYLTVSSLNLSMFLVGTVGGVGVAISLFVNIPMRCYNRISMMIMFLGLLMAAMLVDETVKKHRKAVLPILSAVMVAIGFYDQTAPWDSQNMYAYDTYKNMMDVVEEKLEPGDSVFVLPYDNWPTAKAAGGYLLHMGYIETEGIHWSYGAMQGREEAEWQESVALSDTDEMIIRLQEAGYDGIFLNRPHYERLWGEGSSEYVITDLTLMLDQEPVYSDDNMLCFWTIGEEKAE